MGIYFMDVRMVNKASQSAVAKAAYISGEKLHSERDSETKFYKREESPISFILKPDHAPEWALNREKLWNEAESIERNYNSQVAREVVFALPIELSKEKNIELVKEYVQNNFVDKGMVADCNIHYDREQNPHAHILLTIRPFEKDGSWGAKSKKEYKLDENGNYIFDENGKKSFYKLDLTGGWNSKESLLEWRKNLAEIINQKYIENGINEKVSHLSNEDLGKKEVARKRLERTEYAVEEKHKKFCAANGIEYTPITTFGKINFDIYKVNEEIKELNNQIETLELEKISIEFNGKNIVSDLVNIHKNSLSNRTADLINSYKFVSDRFKVSDNAVNYSHVNTLKTQLMNWERSINGKARELNARFHRLELIDKAVKTGESLSKFGLDNINYGDFKTQEIQSITEAKINLESERQKFEEGKSHLSRVEKNEYQILFKQFNIVYPEYKNVVKYKTFENGNTMYEEMSKFVATLNKAKISKLEHPSLEIAETHKWRSAIINNLDKAKNVIPSYFSLNKQFAAITNDLNQAVIEKNDSNKINQLNIKYFEVKENFEFMKTEYKNVLQNMDAQLQEIYNVDLSQLHPKVKQELLQIYLDTNEPKALDKYFEQNPDMKEVTEKQNQSGGLLEALITASISAQQENNKNKYDKDNKKNKKYGFEKGK